MDAFSVSGSAVYHRPQQTRRPPPGRRTGLRQPVAPPARRRRLSGWPGRTLIGLAGFALGILSGYATDVIKLKFPASVIADIGADFVSTTVVLERVQEVQGELWVYPFRVSTRPEVEEVVLRPVGNLDEFHQRLRKSGAIDANVTVAKLIVEGSRNKPVRIIDMRAVAVSKSEPLTGGTVLVPGPQAAADSAQVAFDLDSDDMIAQIPDNEYGPYFDEYFTGRPAFGKYTVVLDRGEQHVFQVTARTFRYHVRWNIELDVFSDGRTTTVTADVNGSPMETSAVVAVPGDSQAGPDVARYAEVYDFLTPADAGRFTRTK